MLFRSAMYQMEEQEKTPEKQLNEVEIGNLPEKEKGSWLSQLFSQQIPSLLLYIGLFNCNRENNLDNFALERVN